MGFFFKGFFDGGGKSLLGLFFHRLQNNSAKLTKKKPFTLLRGKKNPPNFSGFIASPNFSKKKIPGAPKGGFWLFHF